MWSPRPWRHWLSRSLSTTPSLPSTKSTVTWALFTKELFRYISRAKTQAKTEGESWEMGSATSAPLPKVIDNHDSLGNQLESNVGMGTVMNNHLGISLIGNENETVRVDSGPSVTIETRATSFKDRNREDEPFVLTSCPEDIMENNRSELERLDRERQADFLTMLKGFVHNQVGYAEKIANVWTKVAEEAIKLIVFSPTLDMPRKSQMCGQRLRRRPSKVAFLDKA